jgi:hypothetical protein
METETEQFAAVEESILYASVACCDTRHLETVHGIWIKYGNRL